MPTSVRLHKLTRHRLLPPYHKEKALPICPNKGVTRTKLANGMTRRGVSYRDNERDVRWGPMSRGYTEQRVGVALKSCKMLRALDASGWRVREQSAPWGCAWSTMADAEHAAGSGALKQVLLES
jgi:hypothetical protein